MKIYNRIGKPTKDGWYQIEVTGEHPASEGRVQVIDLDAVTSISTVFNRDVSEAGMLVDADHLSHDLDEKTEAYGWLMETRVNKAGELEGRIDWSDLGESAIKNKRYKFFSSEFEPEDLESLGEGRVRPLKLSGLALTNRPNNKGGKPISNREDADKGDSKTKTITMKNIAEKLGLKPDASEEEILSKITALTTKVSEMEGKANEAEADKIMNTHKGKIPEEKRDSWRKQLITNRAATVELLEGLPEISGEKEEKKTPIHNRSKAGTPAPVKGEEEDENKAQKRDAAVRAIQNRDKCKFQRAWETARSEHKDLF